MNQNQIPKEPNTRSRLSTFLIWILLSIVPLSAFAQTGKSISGKIIDETGEPMIGVAIRVKGTTNGSVTDMDGAYKLTVPSGKQSVEVSYIGYATTTIEVGESAILNITMTPDVQNLDELVVVGYGTVKKRDLTGAVVSIKSSDVTINPTSNVMESLAGKVSGMDIVKESGQVGSDVKILLRGSRSIYGDNSPLFIIDGIPGSYNQINPSDIESVEVLKDASSTAIYGSAGANGVVIISTKRGKEGKATVNFDAYFGFSGKPEYAHGMVGDEWTNYQREAYKYANGQYPADMSSILTDASKYEDYNAGRWVDWVDQASGRTAINQKYSLSVAGGTAKTKIFGSVTYDNQQGLLRNEDYNRYSIRLNIDQDIFTWARAGFTSNINYTDTDAGVKNSFTKALSAFPIGTPYNEDGSIRYEYANKEYTPLGDLIKDQFVNNTRNTYVNATAYLEIMPFKGMSIKSVINGITNNTRLGQYWGEQCTALRPSYAGSPHAEITNTWNYGYTWENVANYTTTIKRDHNISATLVSSWAHNQMELNKAAGSGQIVDAWSFHRLWGATAARVESDYTQTQKMSYAARFNYSYKGKYLLSLSSRWDGVSWLSSQNKWDVFPAAAFAWRISDENFMKPTQTWLSNLKLRVGYGITGNSGGLGAYSSSTMAWPYSSAGITVDGKVVPFIQYTGTYGNATLGWEKSNNLNIGLDMGFINGRIDASLEYFDTYTNGLLFKRTMPVTSAATGWGSPLASWQNIAQTSNRGVELTVNSRNIVSKHFNWNTNLTFSWSTERIESLPSGDLIAENLFIGQPIKSHYSYKYDGLWGADTPIETLAAYGVKPGFVKIATVPKKNADGTDDNGVHKYSTADRQILGHENPDFIVGLNNTFTLHDFDLSIFAMARMGQTIKSDLLGWYSAAKPGSTNQPAGVDYWTEQNQNAFYPIPGSGSEQTTYLPSLIYRDGSFLKIKNITLGYTLPQKISRHAKLERCRFYATAYNPFVMAFDKQLRGTDPENKGSDSFPLYRQFVFGINLTF